MELSIFLFKHNIKVSDIGNICLNDVIDLIPIMKRPQTNYKIQHSEPNYFFLPKLLINIISKYINLSHKIKKLHKLLKIYILNGHSYLANLSIYLISIPERVDKDEYKIGSFKGAIGELLNRYMTPLIIPIIFSFIGVTNYKIIEKHILKDLDKYRIINLRGNKSEWIKLNKESIINVINKNIKKYDTIIPIEKTENITIPRKIMFSSNIEKNLEAGNNIFWCDGVKITIVKDSKNILWFYGNNIATVLGYCDTKNAISRHVKLQDKTIFNNLKKYFSAIPLGSQPHTTYINESGLYSLIMGSKQQEAEKFKYWITSEILPSIRKTGQYSV